MAASLTSTKLTSKGAQTRQRIVAVAAELIFAQGVAATTLDEVRAAARVSSSQIYHYFADKDALVRAVIQHQSEAVLDQQRELFAKLDTLEGLRAWRDVLVEHQRVLQCRGGCPIGSLGSELAETDAGAREYVAEGFQRWEAAIRDGLRRMAARGALVDGADPDRLAAAMLAALQGGLLLTQIKRTAQPLEAALDTMIEHVALLTKR